MGISVQNNTLGIWGWGFGILGIWGWESGGLGGLGFREQGWIGLSLRDGKYPVVTAFSLA